MKVAFYTLGCKVNGYETEVLTEKFIEKGCEIVPFSELADIYVVNTCTVTAISDRKSRTALRNARKRNPSAIVVAAGCYPQAAADEVKSLDDVDIIVGTANKYDLVELALSKARTFSIPDITRYIPYSEDTVLGNSTHTRAIIKIEDGCNNFCSYCKIPFARGRVRSKPLETAVKEFEGLVKSGYKEIVVTGIEIASYGEDTGDSLSKLLCKFDSLCDDNTRIRLGSLEPRLITEDFAKKISSLTHICPQFHLSMQSGCDTVLKRMNRKYDTALFENSVNLLRKYIKDVQITTDLIAGFPGETEEEFEQTLAFLKKIRFLKVHVFPYSKREGTAACRMDGHLTKAVKAERAAAASKLCDGIRKEILESYIGKTVSVLFETQKDGVWSGYTPNYIPVEYRCDQDLSNTLLTVEIVSSDGDKLIAK